jgi:SAM-dependent methyltransferase
MSEAENLLSSMRNAGWQAPAAPRILNVGCANGARVYQLRDAGYDAYGFDFVDTVQLRQPCDRAWFSSLVMRADPSDTRVPDEAVFLPYKDATFDLVFSEVALERCHALGGMMRECARVLKPGGMSIHAYPSRNAVLEPRFLVPFGGRIQSDWWLALWAMLGIRNTFQRGLSVRQTVAHNRSYLDIGVCYRSDREIASIARRYFEQVSFERRKYYAGDPPPSQIKRYWAALRGKDKLARLAAVPRLQILVAR